MSMTLLPTIEQLTHATKATAKKVYSVCMYPSKQYYLMTDKSTLFGI